jgi:uncharacterized membrane protein YgcG
MNELADALETCLRALEEGQSVEAALAQHPDFESELRPLLESSLLARGSRQLVIPEEVKRRGRAHLLQRAAEMRESKRGSHRRMIPIFPRAVIALGLVAVLVLTSTGFVSASSGALPGDQLYPVKRTWEGLRLFFVLNPEGHDLLESQFDQERLDEIDELLGKKQTAPISFTGLVSRQADGQWLVSGIPVSVTEATVLSTNAISDGAPVMIMGITRSDGVVQAEHIQLLQPGGPLPPFEPSENSEPTGSGEQEDAGAASTPVVVVTPSLSATGSQKSAQGQKTYQFSGVVQSMKGEVWIINGQSVQMDQADKTGNIKIGSVVRFYGYFGSDGKFVVTTVQVKSSGNSNSQRNDSGSNTSGNSGNNSGDHEQPGGGGGESGGGSSSGGEDGGH